MKLTNISWGKKLGLSFLTKKKINQEELSQNQRKTLSLKATVVGAILLTVSTTAVIVYVPWWLISQKNVESIIAQVSEEIAGSTSQKVAHIFNNARASMKLIEMAVYRDLIDFYNPEERKDFLMSLLQANKDLTFVQFAYPNGNYIGVQRLETSAQEEAVNVHFRQWYPELNLAVKTSDRYQINNLKTEFIESTEIEEAGWYAPLRPWYQKAIKKPGEEVATVYVYRSTNTPGIDLTVALEREGEILGVPGVGFELKQISQYLQTHHSNRNNGVVFIVNSQGELIASTDPQENNPTQVAGQDVPDLKRLELASNPYMQLATAALAMEGVSLTALEEELELVYQDPVSRERYYINFTPLPQADWRLATVIPESMFLGDIKRNQQILILVVSGFVLVTIAAAVFASERAIVRPIYVLAEAAKSVEGGNFQVADLKFRSNKELEMLARTFNQMVCGLKERERERDIFGRVVSPEVREQLLKGQLQLGGETCRVSVLFSDIRSFSTLSEQMEAEEVVAFLNEYMTEMSAAIGEWGGYINNFIGDAIVAIFGAPMRHLDMERRAVGAALAMRDRLAKLNQRRLARGEVELQSGIGISTGYAVAGQIGSLERLLYTVIGDAVNVAARLETLTKDYGDRYPILVNGPTAKAIALHHNDIAMESLGMLEVKGRAQPVDVYAVTGWQESGVVSIATLPRD